MRILHVATPAAFGGLERVVAMLALSQREAGEDVHVASLAASPAATTFLARLAAGGVATHQLATTDHDLWSQRRALGRLAHELHPTVVHTHGYRADLLATGIGGRTPAVVTTLHGFTGGDLKLRCYEWLQRLVARYRDGVVAVSRAMAQRLATVGVPSDRLHVIPNIPPPAATRLSREEARRALALPKGAWVIGWVGRLSHEKGCDLLLEAVALLQTPGVVIVVLGDGAERPALEEQALRLGIADAIRWQGAVPEADRYFAAFDLLVLSSRTEGSPVVLHEAIAAGVPVVATAVGGIPETVTAASALLVPPEDIVGLAGAITQVRRDPAKAARRARRARTLQLEQGDHRRWVQRYSEVYDTARFQHGS